MVLIALLFVDIMSQLQFEPIEFQITGKSIQKILQERGEKGREKEEEGSFLGDLSDKKAKKTQKSRNPIISTLSHLSLFNCALFRSARLRPPLSIIKRQQHHDGSRRKT